VTKNSKNYQEACLPGQIWTRLFRRFPAFDSGGRPMRKVILLVISGLAASVRGTGSFDVRTDGDKPALVLTTTLAYQL
jgi:hypothetical protein